MGGCISKSKHIRGFDNVDESQLPDSPEEEEWTEENASQQIDKLLKDMQEHNLKRMKDEVETDINTFVLNNLLMCMQFFDNFERSKDAANQFKRDKESEINHKLSEEPQDGMILGDRRCHLLHGMGHILAQNYIYRAPDTFYEEEFYGSHYYSSDYRNTFMCEGILPLEFTMTWDNLELYQNSEWEILQDKQYSAAKGSPPILRFCMEEPDSKNNVPRGFLRLRCVDVAADIYRPLTDPSYDYTYAGARYSDQASAVATSDSEGTVSDETSGSDIDPEFLSKLGIIPTNNNNEEKFQPLRNPLALKQGAVQNEGLQSDAKPLSRNEATQKSMAERLKNRRPSGIMPQNYPSKQTKPNLHLSKLNSAYSEPNIPSVKVNQSMTPPVTNNQPPVFTYGNIPPNSLYPPVNRSNLRSRQSQSMLVLNGHSSSSGYERSNGFNSSAMSRSSSIASEEIRSKWRQVELKQLWQYPAKNRGKVESEAEIQEPLSSNCFMPIELEIDDEEEDAESNSDDESDDDSNKAAIDASYETRYYLNSIQFSSQYCSEFHYIGLKQGLPKDAVSQAVVLGTTIRCSVPYTAESNEDSFHVVHTYTPCLRSKYWPPSYYFWFNQRLLNRKQTSILGNVWPSLAQVERIENMGSGVIPLGLRSIEFFNKQQSLEWQLNFAPAETDLLNSLKHVHWRAYVFSSLIFRAFIAPLGPQGIGIEHIRNIIYFMCHEDFVGWNDEQPGVHLRAILSKLYDCLAKGKMPNFFIQSQDLLKSVPPQNARLVQGHLRHLKDNLTIYCIYAFRNLTCVQSEGMFYPMPNFKTMYDILTLPEEKDLLRIQNPNLALGMEELEKQLKETSKQKKKKNEKLDMNLLENEAMIEGEFRTFVGPRPTNKPDKAQIKAKRRYERYKIQMKEQKAHDRELQRQRASPDEKIPTIERRKSIDLKQSTVIQEKFSTLRKVLVIDFFIKHFIQMAKQSNEFRAYAQSTMYIMQVENLCDILLDSRYNLGQTTVDEHDIKEYKSQCQMLREVVGKELREYVLQRFPDIKIPSTSTHIIIGELNKVRGAFHNNWDFRKLPTPPGSHVDVTEWEKQELASSKISRSTKKLQTPNMVKTFASLQSISPIPSESSSAKLARRTESIKFIDKPLIIKRTMSRPSSRQSVILDDSDQSESTDL